MPTILTVDAIDQSTIGITAAFLDDDDNPVTPNEAMWSLTDKFGNVINGRLDEAISPLSTSATIALTEDDLKYTDGPRRVFTVEYRYDSDLGNDLLARDFCEFLITKVVKAKT